MSEFPPARAQVLVIGGGPAGSYAATCLVREGIDVVILEADKFPRYHVGESQLASMRHFLRYIDLDETFCQHGFKKKVGAAFKLNNTKREGFTDFIATDEENYAWNVIRSESDELMLRHASKCGAQVFEETKVTEVEFDEDRPVAVRWQSKQGRTGSVSFDYLIDASGRVGILSTKYLHTRTFNQSLKNVASWGYWEGTDQYAPGTKRADSPFFEALNDESGWAWFIPLHDGTTSVGVVMNQEISIRKKRASPGSDSKSFYLSELKRAPNLMALIGDGVLVKKEGQTIRSASDYSYSASSYAGPNYRCIGDAAAFIDPYFSSGVHLALAGGLAAATSISAVIRGDCEPLEASQWHSARVGTSYTRFLVVVLSAYQQIRHQAKPILSDINERDFDRAFGHFRSIIQGTTDTNKSVSHSELSSTIQFCSKAFDATNPNEKVEARKFMRTEDTLHIKYLVSDALEGFRMRLVRGQLGLDRA